MGCIAHTKNALGKYHPLNEHLHSVADTAAQFAASLGPEARQLAYYLGLWHDIGKYNPAFQQYLFDCEVNPSHKGKGPDHKAAGARLALKYLEPLAMLVQGHHGGLQSPADCQTWLKSKEADAGAREATGLAFTEIPDLEPADELPTPAYIEQDATAAEMFLRLIFSALVDADHLDTEHHFTPDKTNRRYTNITLAYLWERFEADQTKLDGKRDDKVSQVRHEIYEHCLRAAEEPTGLFRLAVPTGGGKTRSGMAFALRHALRHNLERIIVAVPFISITEQTTKTYRDIFERIQSDEDSEDAQSQVVLEHHSGGLQPTGDEEDFHPTEEWQRLAAENWDAPIVVTTTVQLFESLFANLTSPCRKLHRLARSIIILDEAQALPSHLLNPILDGLRQLCRYYSTTVVISTATQPAFDTIPIFRDLPAREIVPEPARYFNDLRRVEYEWRVHEPVSWKKVAGEIGAERQVLCVVNTKRDAMALLDALGEDEHLLHLSTQLCGAHRRAVIEDVKARLKGGEQIRLVSTQVIEAGVDLDFPVVWRALGPLDSVIQSAGRCNREGRLGQRGGKVVVFKPEGGGMPKGAYLAGAGITGALLGEGDLDPDKPEWARRFFQQLFQTIDTDGKKIQPLRARFHYKEVAQRFEMIGADSQSMIVSYGTPGEQKLVDNLLWQLQNHKGNPRFLWRRIQPYVVSLRTKEADRNRDLASEIVPGLYRWTGEYDRLRGWVGDIDKDSLYQW